MRFIELQEKLRGFPVFSLDEIRLLDESFHRQRLTEWQARGYVRKVIRGFYVLSTDSLDENTLFAIANRIYAPSYVSLESALAEYRLIPEAVYSVTSVTTRKTAAFETPLARFSYRTIRPPLFQAYRVLRTSGFPMLIASPEKAIFDFLYLRQDINAIEDIGSLRIDRSAAKELIDPAILTSFEAMHPSKSFRRRLRLFREYLDHA
jgi:predicted transcriptional regulator of viral defense system